MHQTNPGKDEESGLASAVPKRPVSGMRTVLPFFLALHSRIFFYSFIFLSSVPSGFSKIFLEVSSNHGSVCARTVIITSTNCSPDCAEKVRGGVQTRE